MAETSRRVALISGASGSIGGAIAQRLAPKFDLALHAGVDRDALGRTAIRCRELGATVSEHVADLAETGAATALFDAAVAEHGRIDAIVHNAAHTDSDKLHRLSADTWRRSFAVNVDALYEYLHHGAKTIADGGRVVAISSANVRFALPGSAAYTASKAAAEALIRVAAGELGRRQITCNSVQLGLIDNDLSRRLVTPEVIAMVAARTSVGRNGEAADAAGAVAFLLSEEADWITGSTLTVDGGVR